MFHRSLCFLAILLLTPCPATAVDGVIEINQAKVLAGGVTNGDAPGFPVEILKSGSYRLTSDLESGSGGEVIQVREKAVDIDLNGFTIRCSGEDPPDGIQDGSQNAEDLTVRNGTIRGCDRGIAFTIVSTSKAVIDSVRVLDGNDIGISCRKTCTVRNSIVAGNEGTGVQCGTTAPDACFVENSQIRNNGGLGVSCGDDCVVVNSAIHENALGGIAAAVRARIIDNTVVNNPGGSGIATGSRATVDGNTVVNNGTHGILVEDGSKVSNNVASDNGGDGINAGADAVIRGNNTSGNSESGIEVGRGAVVAENLADKNDGIGINADTSCVIVGNVSDINGSHGFEVKNASLFRANIANTNGGAGFVITTGGSAVGNVARTNTSFGLDSNSTGVLYKDNIFSNNNGGNANPQTDSGTDAGGNICGATLGCP